MPVGVEWGDPLIATFSPPLCSACIEPELDNWRKKEGLIKFIMNCHVHRSSMRRPTAMQLRIRSEPYLGSLSSSNVCSPFQFDFARATSHFATISKIARDATRRDATRRRDTISVRFCSVGAFRHTYLAVIRSEPAAAALVNVKIIEIVRSLMLTLAC